MSHSAKPVRGGYGARVVGMVSSRTALLTALGADNAGSGLFLPVALLYVTRDVGLPLAVAGTVVALGTVAGLAVPPLAGHLGDRIGPRRVVVGAELLQALGAVTYLAARGAAAVTAAAVLLAAGQQLFEQHRGGTRLNAAHTAMALGARRLRPGVRPAWRSSGCGSSAGTCPPPPCARGPTWP